MFSSLNTIFQFWRVFWQKFGTKNNNNNKVILKIAYALNARDQKFNAKFLKVVKHQILNITAAE